MDKDEFYRCVKKQILITDYAREIGFTLVKKGKYYSLKEHDSVIIDPRRNCFWQNSVSGSGASIGKGGSIIDFAIQFTCTDMKDILREFGRRISGSSNKKRKQPEKINHQKKMVLPNPDVNMHRVFAYLTQTRAISGKVVQEMVDRKMLYQDTSGNCVFVGYDITKKEKTVFACRRGTNTYKPFYGDVAGCDYNKCFYIDNCSRKLIITESFIDAMSVMTLCKDKWKEYNYLPLAGSGKWKAVITYLITGTIDHVIIATDNDKTGIETARQICFYIKENYKEIRRTWKLPPKGRGKDWNEVLVKGVNIT